MNKKKVDNIISKIGSIFVSIGIPLTVIGVGIVMFSGLFGKEQIIGTTISVTGVFLTSLALPILIIKLLLNYDSDEVNDD